VRSETGKVLGLFNTGFFQPEGQKVPIANFVFAGDKVVVLAVDRLWIVQIAEMVVNPQRFG
jgi:hypothetical protein